MTFWHVTGARCSTRICSRSTFTQKSHSLVLSLGRRLRARLSCDEELLVCHSPEHRVSFLSRHRFHLAVEKYPKSPASSALVPNEAIAYSRHAAKRGRPWPKMTQCDTLSTSPLFSVSDLDTRMLDNNNNNNGKEEGGGPSGAAADGILCSSTLVQPVEYTKSLPVSLFLLNFCVFWGVGRHLHDNRHNTNMLPLPTLQKDVQPQFKRLCNGLFVCGSSLDVNSHSLFWHRSTFISRAFKEEEKYRNSLAWWRHVHVSCG